MNEHIEAAYRAGFAAAEEALGAHGSERLLDAIERSWKEYALDNAVCTIPPPGWTCSRAAGHGGPCAASPVISGQGARA